MSWCTCAHIIFFFFGQHWAAAQDNAVLIHYPQACAAQGDELLFFFVCLLVHCFLFMCFETIPDLLCSLCCCITINNRVSYLTAVFCFQAEFCIYPFLGMCMQHPWRLPSWDSSLLDPFCFPVVLSSLQWYCFLNLYTICFRLYSSVCIVIMCPVLH